MTETTAMPKRGVAGVPDWLDSVAPPLSAACPNCQHPGTKRPVLRMLWPGLVSGQAVVHLLRCPHCDCGFFHPVQPADYDSTPVGGEAALAFYLQQGAGIFGMTATLAALGRPAGTRMLEVGCGFGFGLDFARRGLGWDVLGLDPSPFAAVGRRQLGLPIESRYLVPNDAAATGAFDVVMASEVIEHVASPLAFIRILAGALREGGTLVMTTPDMDAATPETLPGLLVPLLSAGYHLVLQSKASLERLLHQAGFVDVVVQRVGGASLAAQGHLGVAAPRLAAAGPHAYDRYLEAAASAAPCDEDLWVGLVARSYRSAVNKADCAAADAAWVAFSASCRRRFGFDPEAAQSPIITTLEDLAASEPLCLGPVLFHRAQHRMLLGEGRSAVEPVFAAASAACARLRGALQRIGTDDGDAEEVAWLAEAEGILCAAERGAPDVPERLAALGPGPAGDRAASFRRRAFVSPVNAGRLDDADRLGQVVAAVTMRLARESASLADEELDVLYCAATRELQAPGGSAELASRLLRQLDLACAARRNAGARSGSAVSLAEPARQAEILALEVLGRHTEADRLREPLQPAGAASRV